MPLTATVVRAAATIALAATVLTTPSAHADTAPVPKGKVASFWLHMNSTPVSDATLATEAVRRSYIVLNAWESAYIPKLKKANPAVQVYVYKDLSSTRDYACRDGVDDKSLPTGVGYCDANKNHPEWFMTDPSGKRLAYGGYAGHWQMDVGNADYQRAWATNVLADVKATGFDGVFLDNALFGCDTYHPGVCPARYRTDADLQGAYKAMLWANQQKFADAGVKTVANLSNARVYAGAWDAYMAYVDGGFDEWWLTFSSSDMLPEYKEGWSRQVGQVTANESRGKITWVQPHFTRGDDRPYRYALASYLMASGLRAAVAEIDKTDGYGDAGPWHPEYDWDLGSPVGGYRSVGTNVFQRDFTCGTAVVNANPTTSPKVTVRLGATYRARDGKSVGSVSLPGTSGEVLRKTCTAVSRLGRR